MKNNTDKEYLRIVKDILDNGKVKKDRTGTGTKSIFGTEMRINMSEGFPLLTSKKMYTKGIIHELIWFLNGDTNIKYLVDNNCNIWNGDAYRYYSQKCSANSSEWNEWMRDNGDGTLSMYTKDEFIEKIKSDQEFCDKWGDLGPIYGSQWRSWTAYDHHNGIAEPTYKPVDQISNLINDLKNNPDSRRLMVTAWNPAELSEMALPPCHYGFQCYTFEMELHERQAVWSKSINKHDTYADKMTHEMLDAVDAPKRKLTLMWNQRSIDTFLGLPYNITSYAILLMLIAREVNMVPHELIYKGDDTHLYLNYLEQAKEKLTRETYKLSKLVLKNEVGNGLFDLKYEDFEIIDYQCASILKGELSN